MGATGVSSELRIPQGEIARIPAGTVLIVVEEGVVVVRAMLGERTMMLAICGPDDVVPAPSENEVIEAAEVATLRLIDDVELAALVADPETAHGLVAALAGALRERQESLAQFAAATHAERLAAKLIQLARKHGRVTPQGIRIDVPLTHQLLAESIGAARETVTVALRELRREGLIDREGRTYIVKIAPGSLG
jgi:CRP/FNR family transcriptional regulator, cyclic AMP receptor protein